VNTLFAMHTRTAARLAADEASACELASASDVLSADLFGVLWPSLDASTKAALRGVGRAMRQQVDGLVEVVAAVEVQAGGGGGGEAAGWSASRR
jgi:hypothetical protein